MRARPLAFAYNAPACHNVIDNWIAQVLQQPLSPAIALQQIVQQVNAVEGVSAAEQSAGASIGARFPTNGWAIAYTGTGP